MAEGMTRPERTGKKRTGTDSPLTRSQKQAVCCYLLCSTVGMEIPRQLLLKLNSSFHILMLLSATDR